MRQVIAEAMQRANLTVGDLSHLNASGMGTIEDDPYEAQAIHAALGDVPVTALKSVFGHLGAGCGAVELAASLVGIQKGEIPRTLNYETPDPACPVNVVTGEQLKIGPASSRNVLKLSSSRLGHAAALVVTGDV